MSVWVVVGFAARLGSKLSWSQPVVAGHGAFGVVGLVVVGERRRSTMTSGPTQVVGFWIIGAIGSELGTFCPVPNGQAFLIAASLLRRRAANGFSLH